MSETIQGVSQRERKVITSDREKEMAMACPAIRAAPSSSPLPIRWATSAWPTTRNPNVIILTNMYDMNDRAMAARYSGPRRPTQNTSTRESVLKASDSPKMGAPRRAMPREMGPLV